MQASELASGRWPGLLVHFGVDRTFLSGRHTPCPACDGGDRFRFDDKEGRGTFFCSHCGAGDGFKLLNLVKGWSFKQAALEIETVIGTIPENIIKSSMSGSDKVAACKRIWRESKVVTVGDPVHAYLQRRTAMTNNPSCIRFHPTLAYRHDDGSKTRHPAMVARVTDNDGKGVAIHRTYLTEGGHKADVPTAKKVIGILPASSAIQLFDAGPCLGIAEGIETALSASMRFGVPVWSCISSVGMEKWSPPDGTGQVIVFGDNDLSGTGQTSAWILAKRLIAAGIKAEVKIPAIAGKDWDDIARLERGEE